MVSVGGLDLTGILDTSRFLRGFKSL